ncbi:hypothetical protein ACFVUS_29245 [Nocardia sp. NPDC058058]|uniref:hypothetical protein n=1 Tax=Nocardia sp. NPDC058058 TaxID=3346317 RepID=UPI0036DC20E0
MASSDVADMRTRIINELTLLRRRGMTRLRVTPVPTIADVSRVVLGSDEPAAIERLLRQAIDGLGGGQFGRAGLLLFGPSPGTRGRKPKELREMAALELELQPDTFRKGRELRILEQIAEQMIGLVVLQRVTMPSEPAEDRRARLERLAAEIAALPAADLGPLVQLLRSRLGVPD